MFLIGSEQRHGDGSGIFLVFGCFFFLKDHLNENIFCPELVVRLFFFFFFLSVPFLQFCVSSYEGSRRDAERDVFGADNAVVGLLLEIFRC